MDEAKRGAGGRFLKGTKGGPGRPKRAVEADYLRSLTDAVSLDEWRAMVLAVVEQAKQGDMRSISWLGRYLLGTPGANTPTLGDLARSEAQVDEHEAGGDVDAGMSFDIAAGILEGLRQARPAVPVQRHEGVREALERLVAENGGDGG